MSALADALAVWSRRHALRPLVFGSTCCAGELAAVLAPHLDHGRAGLRPQVDAPAQADLLIVAGRLSVKAIPLLRQTYDAMAPPRWVMTFGSCATAGGLFDTYAVARGAIAALSPDVSVDVHVPGCPPDPADLCDALEALRQRKGISTLP